MQLGLKRHSAGRDVLAIGHVAAADVGSTGERHAGRQAVHHAQVAAARDLIQRFGIQRHARRRRGDVDDRRTARDRHRLLDAADLHRDVEAGHEADRQAELVANEGGEAGELERDAVDADRQLAEPIVAFSVARRDHLPDLDCRARQGGRHAGQRGARFVLDGSMNDTGGAAALGQCARRCDCERDDRSGSAEKPVVRIPPSTHGALLPSSTSRRIPR